MSMLYFSLFLSKGLIMLGKGEKWTSQNQRGAVRISTIIRLHKTLRKAEQVPFAVVSLFNGMSYTPIDRQNRQRNSQSVKLCWLAAPAIFAGV